MDPLFTEGKYYTEAALNIETEISFAMKPIIEKYLDQGYGHHEVCFLALQAAHDATLMVSLDRASRVKL